MATADNGLVVDSGLETTRHLSESSRASTPGAQALLEQPALDALRPGRTLGRYLIIEEQGRGGMGVVLRAYDPKLQREVALKVLRPGALDSTSELRMIHEARAQAKLSHAHVVAVYDVELELENRTMIVMEFVDGRNLRRWLRESSRSWPEIIEVFLAAGRGLAAAHAKGLLHRDFKPSNVMVTTDGQIKVTDFGLAKLVGGGATSTEVSSDAEATRVRSKREGRPLPSAQMGTPRYMAPEQHAGRELDSSTDQYAFCVALWEALTGQPPFDDQDLEASKQQGAPPWPRGCFVPGHIVQALARGLSVDPEARWPSLDALLLRLSHARSRWRRRGLIAGVAGLAVVAGGLGIGHLDRIRRRAACDAQGQTIDEVWNDEARQGVHAGIMASRASYAEAVARNVMPWLDGYAEAWKEWTVEACLEGSMGKRWDSARLDAAQWCLEDRRLAFGTLVKELTQGGEQGARRAVQAAAGLPLVAACVDDSMLASVREPPTPDVRPRVARVREILWRARAQEAAGRYDDGLHSIREAEREIEVLSWLPLTAAVLFTESSLLSHLGEHVESEAVGIEAYKAAALCGSWNVAASVASMLVFEVGYQQARHAEAEIWAEHAQVAVQLSGDPLGLLEAQRSSSLGTVFRLEGRYAEARAAHQRALELRVDALGSEHPSVAGSLTNLGNVLRTEGDLAQAQAMQAEALGLFEKALGPDHPSVATCHDNLGIVLALQGQPDESRAHFERALTIFEESLGPEHADLARCLNNLANVEFSRGDYEGAAARYRRVLAIWERTLSPDHQYLASALNNLGHTYLEMGELGASRASYARALAIQRATLAPDHPDLLDPLHGMARVLLAQGEHRAAASHQQQGIDLMVARQRSPQEIAERRFELAQILWDAPDDEGRDRVRSLRLAQQARDAYPSGHDARASIEAWLAPRSPTTR